MSNLSDKKNIRAPAAFDKSILERLQKPPDNRTTVLDSAHTVLPSEVHSVLTTKQDIYVSTQDLAPDSNTASATKEIKSENNTVLNSKSKRWSFIQNDLSKAMDTWQELEKAEVGLSPEEEQLIKIKTIISQLKDKLEQF